MKDFKNYKAPETMTPNQVGIVSFIAGAAFWCSIEMFVRGTLG